jgi:hypothetical protein
MSSLPRLLLSATSFFLFTCETYAQQATPEKTGTVSISFQEANNPPGTRTIDLSAPSPNRPVVTGAPYSAEVVTEHIQTLVDGTHITGKTQSAKDYRDSEGRTREETSPGGAQVVEIHDAISGFSYLLDVQNHVAHRFASPPDRANAVADHVQTGRMGSLAANSAPAGETTPAQPPVDRPQRSTESLGTQVIEGMYVEGERITITFPVGAMGNDRPLVRVTESWFSPDLRITVLSKNSDPRRGEFTMHLQNINRSEPDPALFRVPSDYQIVDENGDRVQIKFTHP